VDPDQYPLADPDPGIPLYPTKKCSWFFFFLGKATGNQRSEAPLKLARFDF
jgi:hypothetical protein